MKEKIINEIVQFVKFSGYYLYPVNESNSIYFFEKEYKKSRIFQRLYIEISNKLNDFSITYATGFSGEIHFERDINSIKKAFNKVRKDKERIQSFIEEKIKGVSYEKQD